MKYFRADSAPFGTTVLVAGALLTLIGCGGQPPAVTSAPVETAESVQDVSTTSSHRIRVQSANTRITRSSVHKDALFAPPGSRDAVVAMRGNRPFLQSPVLTKNGVGIKVVRDTGESLHTFAPGEVSVAEESFDQDSTAQALVTELLPQPYEYHSRTLRIPNDTQLHFSMTLGESSFEGLAFSVLVEQSGVRTEVFREVVGPESASEWISRVVPLTGLGSDSATLIFRSEAPHSRFALSTPMAYTNPVWGDVYLCPPQPEDGRKPNVLLVSLDTLRADRLGTYGYGKPTSPNIDRLAEDALVFERCLAPTSWTTPSHAAAFTGINIMSQPRHPNQDHYVLPDDNVFIAELAREAGYVTAAFTEGLLVAEKFGFGQGYGTYSDGPNAPQNAPISAGPTFEQGREWIDAHAKTPFFLFLHTYQIHSPYEPPEPFRSRFYDGTLDRLVPEINVETDEAKAAASALYDGEIAYTDHALGKLLDHLRDSGVLDNTLVVLFSDHGEEFQDHGGMSHGYTVHEEVLHVPLIVRFPGPDGPKGRIETPVALSDLFSTLADFMGLPPGDSANDSESMLSLCEWPSTHPPYQRTTYTSYLRKIWQRTLQVGIDDGTHRYIATAEFGFPDGPLRDRAALERGGESLGLTLLNYADELHGAVRVPEMDQHGMRELLYDKRLDPNEQKDLAGAEPALRETLRAALRLEVERFQARDGASTPGEAVPMSEEELATLEAVGYL